LSQLSGEEQAAGERRVKLPSDRETGQVSLPASYVVEYDLPADHRRKRFYRAINRYLRENTMDKTEWSTGSVVFTDDEDFAWFVHRQALKTGGTSHIYEARRLDTEP